MKEVECGRHPTFETYSSGVGETLPGTFLSPDTAIVLYPTAVA